MEKELLEKRKVALKKLLNNKQYFCFGLCHLIAILYEKNILTYEESDLLDELVDSYFKNSEEVKKAFNFTISFSDPPAASHTACRFLNTWWACSAKPPSTHCIVVGSNGI